MKKKAGPTTVIVGSTSPESGKSLVTLGLAMRVRADGFELGYLKAFGDASAGSGQGRVDPDARFIQALLSLPDDPESICPVVMSSDLKARVLSGKGKVPDPGGALRKAYRSMGDRDVVVVSGGGSLEEGISMGISTLDLLDMTGARLLLVEKGGTGEELDRILFARRLLGDSLLGVVLNRIPRSSLDKVSSETSACLAKKTVALYGLIAEDPAMGAVSVRELTATLGARLLVGEDGLDTAVRRFSIGAMDVESAFKYFRRIHQKAVVVGGHRSDILMAALETSTRCLILTGGTVPAKMILAQAEDRGIPVLLVKGDTFSTIQKIQILMGKSKIREGRKIERARDLTARELDFAALYADLGLPT